MLGVATGARLSAKNLDTELDWIAGLWSHAIRWYPNWSQVEEVEGSGVFDWTFVDRVVNGCATRGVDVLLGVGTRGDGHALDASHVGPSSKYAAQLAGRYAGMGAFLGLEGPNELMLGRHTSKPKYDPDPTPARYLPLQQAIFEEVKASEPTVLVGLGSIIGQADWLAGLYDVGAKPFFDFVPYHPYTKPLSPTEAMRAGHGGFPSMYDAHHVMVDNGDVHKQVWVTEYGSNTGGHDALSENVQAHDLSDAVRRFRKHAWAGPFFAFCGWDADPISEDPGDSCGLLHADGTDKQAAMTFRALAVMS